MFETVIWVKEFRDICHNCKWCPCIYVHQCLHDRLVTLLYKKVGNQFEHTTEMECLCIAQILVYSSPDIDVFVHCV